MSPIELRQMPNGAFICDSDPGAPEHRTPRISVTPMEGRFLRYLARQNRVLEIGTGLGISAEYMVTSAQRLLTIDTDPWVKEYVWPLLPRGGCGVEMTNSRDGLRPHERFDMVFIDGHHSPEATAEDVRFARTLIDHGLIVVHDAQHESVRDGLGDLSEWSITPTAHGIAVSYVGWGEP